MLKQKTIIITSIYSNLWGTEFGGRPSRENHYKLSLLSILKMEVDKVICFTSNEEIESLKTLVANDIDPTATELMRKNFEFNKCPEEKFKSKSSSLFD